MNIANNHNSILQKYIEAENGIGVSPVGLKCRIMDIDQSVARLNEYRRRKFDEKGDRGVAQLRKERLAEFVANMPKPEKGLTQI